MTTFNHRNFYNLLFLDRPDFFLTLHSTVVHNQLCNRFFPRDRPSIKYFICLNTISQLNNSASKIWWGQKVFPPFASMSCACATLRKHLLSIYQYLLTRSYQRKDQILRHTGGKCTVSTNARPQISIYLAIWKMPLSPIRGSHQEN